MKRYFWEECQKESFCGRLARMYFLTISSVIAIRPISMWRPDTSRTGWLTSAEISAEVSHPVRDVSGRHILIGRIAMTELIVKKYIRAKRPQKLSFWHSSQK